MIFRKGKKGKYKAELDFFFHELLHHGEVNFENLSSESAISENSSGSINGFPIPTKTIIESETRLQEQALSCFRIISKNAATNQIIPFPGPEKDESHDLFLNPLKDNSSNFQISPKVFYPAFGAAALLLITLTIGLFLYSDMFQGDNTVAGSDPVIQTQNLNSARAVFVLGDVKLIKNKRSYPLNVGKRLFQGSEIHTGVNGRCDIQIGKSSLIRIKENSSIKLALLFKDKKSQKSYTDIKLLIGRILIRPKTLQGSESFRIITPTTVAGVRGTKFMVFSDKEANAEISVLEGKVRLKKRIRAFEKTDSSIIESSKILQDIKDQINKETIVLKANEVLRIKGLEVNRLNQMVERVIELYKDLKQNDLTRKNETGEKSPDNLKRIDELLRGKLRKNYILELKKMTIMVSKTQVMDSEQKDELEVFSQSLKIQFIQGKFNGFGMLKVTLEEPKQATIYLNGIKIGQKGFQSALNAKTKYTLRIEKNGYKSVKRNIQIAKGELKQLNIRLQKIRPVLSRIQWQGRVDYKLTGIPAVQKNRVYISSVSGKIFSFDNTGKLIWDYTINSKIQSSPTVYKNLLFVGASDGVLYAFDLTNGEVKWKKVVGSIIYNNRPHYSNGLLYIGTAQGNLMALKSSNGQMLWKFKAGSGIYTTPILYKGLVYFGCEDNKIYALNGKTGKMVWSFKTGKRIVLSSPKFGNNKVYIGSYDKNLYAINAKTGDLAWKFQVDDKIMSSPVFHKGKVYIGSTNGKLYAVNSVSGNLLWSRQMSGRIIGEMVASRGVLYAAIANRVIAINGQNGKNYWQYNLNGNSGTGLLIHGRTIFVSTSKGYVYALNTRI